MEFKTYDKIHQLGHKENKDIFSNPNTLVCLQEKVDGANFRIYIKDGKLIFGSRTQQLTNDEGEDTNLQKNFNRAVRYVRDKLKDVNLNQWNGFTLFMECMVKHTINYNWDITPPVIGFDVYQELDEETNYLHWNVAKKIFEDFGFEFIPIVKVCKASELTLPITDDQVPPSKYTMQQAEGIVFKTFNPRIYGKYVRIAFKEKNKEVFGGKKKYAKDDEEYLTSVYCTNYRIEKVILKLIDEGMSLEMTMMNKLPKRVYEDIWEENLKEIIYLKQRTINFETFKKEVTKRCLNVLQQMIQNNILNTEVKNDN
jgi:hypothetical protein